MLHEIHKTRLTLPVGDNTELSDQKDNLGGIYSENKKNKHYVLIDTMIGLFTSSFCRVVKKSVLVIARNIVLGGSKKEQYINCTLELLVVVSFVYGVNL